MTDLTIEPAREQYDSTPGLSHLWLLRQLDKSGLSHWLLGLGCMLVLTTAAILMLIVSRFPDPEFYRNSVAFTAIISFFMVYYFGMGRGWHRDAIRFLEFDSSLDPTRTISEPGRTIVYVELGLAVIFAYVNLTINAAIETLQERNIFFGVLTFYIIQYTLILFSLDIILRQLRSLNYIARNIRIDLFNGDFYSTLANVMVRNFGLLIFGVCIITTSYIVFTEGELTTFEMMIVTMPWYLPGLIIIAMYLVPYNRFRKRMHVQKQQELNCVAAALNGDLQALQSSLLKDDPQPTKIDLLYYYDRIQRIKEWPFTDRIRIFVLFGILPPLTWVIAALIEISIEAAL